MTSHDYEWRDDKRLVVDGVAFVADSKKRFSSTADEFCLVKPRALVDKHLELLHELRPRTMVELGIFQGGSVALSALIARPDVLVALELAAERVAALDELIAQRGLGEHVHAFYGVDQADDTAVRAAVHEHAGSRPLDLVVDDASHLVEPTRSSFNVLFPLLRPGGVFVLEDWSWAHLGFGAQRPDETPLTRVVFELTMALASYPRLISEMRIDREWVAVVRGDAELDPDGFDLAACFTERGRNLLAP